MHDEEFLGRLGAQSKVVPLENSSCEVSLKSTEFDLRSSHVLCCLIHLTWFYCWYPLVSQEGRTALDLNIFWQLLTETEVIPVNTCLLLSESLFAPSHPVLQRQVLSTRSLQRKIQQTLGMGRESFESSLPDFTDLWKCFEPEY